MTHFLCNVPIGKELAAKSFGETKITLTRVDRLKKSGDERVGRPRFQLEATAPKPENCNVEEVRMGNKISQYIPPVSRESEAGIAFELIKKISAKLAEKEEYITEGEMFAFAWENNIYVRQNFVTPKNASVGLLEHDFENAYNETLRENPLLSTLIRDAQRSTKNDKMPPR